MRKDRNGYVPSIMGSEDGECFICHLQTETARHEIYPGDPNRQISKHNGFWIALCPNCHRIVHEVWSKEKYIKELKKPCELVYQKTHTRKQFYKLIGEYYDE